MSGWYATDRLRSLAAVMILLASLSAARSELPSPVLNTVFPAGGRAGTSVQVTVEGTALDGLTALRLVDPRIACKKGDGNQFTLTLPPDVPPGVYDIRTVGTHGLS